LAADEEKSLVGSINFGGEDAVKTVEAVGECLAIVYKTHPADPWRNEP
jgi:hypothetical protein